MSRIIDPRLLINSDAQIEQQQFCCVWDWCRGAWTLVTVMYLTSLVWIRNSGTQLSPSPPVPVKWTRACWEVMSTVCLSSHTPPFVKAKYGHSNEEYPEDILKMVTKIKSAKKEERRKESKKIKCKKKTQTKTNRQTEGLNFKKPNCLKNLIPKLSNFFWFQKRWLPKNETVSDGQNPGS